jgi:hypothetical protein
MSEAAASAAPSCADLTATLIVEGCLPMIRGDVKGKAPLAPIPVTPEERSKLKLEPNGMTMFYPAQDEGVFFDITSTGFGLWFAGGDVERATDALDKALKRGFPKTKQLDEVRHKRNAKLRARVYRVELGEGRLAAISTSFADLPNGRHKFAVRIQAQQRPG